MLENQKKSYVWSGKIICGMCGSRFIRRVRYKGKKYRKTVWQCYCSVRYGKEKINTAGEKVGCNVCAICETVLERYFNLVLKDNLRNEYIEAICDNSERIIFKALHQIQNDSRVTDIINQVIKLKKLKSKLIDLYTDESISKEEFAERNSVYDRQLCLLDENLHELRVIEEKARDSRIYSEKITDIMSRLISTEEFNPLQCKKLLNKVIVYDDRIKFYLAGNIEKQFFFDKNLVAGSHTI